MAPSPLLIRDGHASITFDSVAALRSRPALALEIGVITAAWATVEASLGELVAEILNTDAKLGLAIFLGLRAEGLQREVIKAAAQEKLPSDLADKVIQAVSDLRDKASGRNHIVHGVWGTCADYPDDLIWIDRKDSIREFSRVASVGTGELKMLIYKQEDLEDISNRIRSADSYLRQVCYEVRRHHLANLRASIRRSSGMGSRG
jgi:hypothetical protein